MTDARLSRRRFIAIAAATTLAPATLRAAPAAQAVRWHGRALGAEASVVIEHADAALARDALADMLAEIGRLEAVFSLHDPRSALSRLNADGILTAPPLDLVRALDEAAGISQASGGAFDVTVQPLWQAHAQAFASSGHPPAAERVAAARRLADWRQVEIGPDRIRFRRPGMAATLNGLAQGYITDRMAEWFRRHGFVNVLVDLGEIRAVARHADGRPWQVAIRDPHDHQRTLRQLSLSDGAMATTEALGSSFSPGGSHGHLIDPALGRPALAVASITVRAPTATLADGLSTAIAVAGPRRAPDILARYPGTSACLQSSDGEVVEL